MKEERMTDRERLVELLAILLAFIGMIVEI